MTLAQVCHVSSILILLFESTRKAIGVRGGTSIVDGYYILILYILVPYGYCEWRSHLCAILCIIIVYPKYDASHISVSGTCREKGKAKLWFNRSDIYTALLCERFAYRCSALVSPSNLITAIFQRTCYIMAVQKYVYTCPLSGAGTTWFLWPCEVICIWSIRTTLVVLERNTFILKS